MPTTFEFSIGEIAARTGTNVETIRYYEKEGLLPKPPRTVGGHRKYSGTHLKRLYFIRRSRELGFSIQQVRELLGFVDESSHTCGEVKALTLQHAKDIQAKIDDLKRLQQALLAMSARCSGGEYPIDDCPIIDSMFNEAGIGNGSARDVMN